MTQNYVRAGTIDMASVIAAVETYLHLGAKGKGSKGERVAFPHHETHPVFVTSLRMQTFAVHGTQCAGCGLQGTHFAFEKSPGGENDSYHLNLYGIDVNGEEVLFTHDHKLARTFGGVDSLENTQTACVHCNAKKSKLEMLIKMTTPKAAIVNLEALRGALETFKKDIPVIQNLLKE